MGSKKKTERSKAQNNDAAASAGGEIVISGLSGKLPESSNIEEFKQNLLNGIDMVTDDSRRWEAGIYGLPERMAKLRDEDLEKFDDTFFSVHQKQAELMDPCMRILLELTHEAIVDAGINPNELRGSRTGVYIGLSFVETEHEIPNMEPSSINGYCLTGCARAMFANRISYNFDFKGPSFIVDTACSSSLMALSHAYTDLQSGRTDYAIVAGVNLILKPIFALQFLRLGIVSQDGSCKTFDASANGYARADTCAVIFLQRSEQAKRIYATILNVRTNTDGFKEQGVTFPDGRMQHQLLREAYSEIGLSPDDVVYVEAHGSGTPVGDDQEANMLGNFFCHPARPNPLLIGSVKSNMGHAEPASGVSALAKMIIAMEEGIIPRNLHYRTPNPAVPALVEGRLKVVDRNLPWQGGIVGLNSFGFGGANVHVILKSHEKKKKLPKKPTKDLSLKLVICSGRTENAVQQLLEAATKHRNDNEFLALINDIHSQPIPMHPYRGFAVLGSTGAVKQEILPYEEERRPIWFVFAGMGSQWPCMAKDLMQLEVFNKSIQHCAEVLARMDFDLIDVLTRSTEKTFDNILNSFVSISAVQVALTDLLRTLNIEPDGIIGHSAGELGAAYMDGCLTAEQVVLAAYWRSRSVLETPGLPHGSMAAVGLSWDEIGQHLPPDCYPVCHNSDDNCTVSGPVASMDAMMAKLKAAGVFVKEVVSGGFAFHSRYVADAAPMLRKNLERLITEPKQRSQRWLSSSVPERDWQTPSCRMASAAYFINNLISPVLFNEALRHIPHNAVIVEIAPHGLFRAILRSLTPKVTYVSLIQRGHANNAEFLLSQIGQLYAAGGQPQLSRMSPSAAVRYPVSRGTPMLNSLIKWDHTQKWSYPKFHGGRQANQLNINIDLSKEENAFLAGHTIDGRILFPATGYLTVAWMMLAQQNGNDYQRTPVVFEDVVFHRATILGIDANSAVKLSINCCQGNNTFEICEGSSLVVSGKLRLVTNVQQEQVDVAGLPGSAGVTKLYTKDVYKELRLRGYEYTGIFQGILDVDIAAVTGRLQWMDNWISFMDTMLQFRILGNNIRELYLPTAIQRVVIDPLKHLELLKQHQQKLPVYWHANISVIKCGGVEIHSMKTAQTQRRPGGQNAPILERYSFTPHIQHTIPRGDQERAKSMALTVAMQLITENSGGAIKIKGVEIAATRNTTDTLNAVKLLELIEREPIMVADMCVATSSNTNESELATLLQDTGVRVIVGDLAKAAVEQQCDFLHAINLLSTEPTLIDLQLQNGIESIKKESGFLLLEESASAYKTTGRAQLQRLQLLPVLEQVYDSDRMLILARRSIDKNISTSLVVRVTNEHFKWIVDLKTALVKSQADQKNVYLVAQGEPSTGALGFINCLKREQFGNRVRLYLLQDQGLPAFSLTDAFYANQLAKDMSINVYRNGNWGSYRHLPLDAHQQLLTVEQAYVNTLVKGDLSSLKWIECPHSVNVDQNKWEPSTVYYAPLNFRDVMLASGKLGVDALPGDLAYQDCVLGLEFAGRDSQGRRIMALVSAKSLATNCLANKNLLWDIPDKWSMEEASTVPCVYATVYYALLVRGQMKKGERILIHAGSGGVGQAAISVALHHGLTVFTTVGSKEKREFLLKRFPKLQARNIGNSRDTSFEQLIMRETNGHGVDLVLNSLSEEKLQASIRCLGLDGRFLEIGKFDLSNNSPLGMSVFLKNTSFHGILLDSVMEGEVEMQKRIVSLVSEGIKSGAVIPLPTTVYADQEIEKAFRFMASGKHIGKVIIKVRNEEEQSAVPKQRLINAIPRTYMHPEKSYIVVGGLGGFGLELTNWLVNRGARHIVLNTHSGLKTGYQALMIRRWSERGVQVVIDINDVTSAVGCRNMLESSNKLGLVGGIFNLAAVLRDGDFEDQTMKNFELVTAPKTKATMHLDQCSRSMCPVLEHFICFSSLAAGRGNPGQTNYALANSSMERICEQRQAEGYPGIAIQWGAIGDTGLIIEHMGVTNNNTAIGGTLPQRMTSCLQTLDTFMQQPHPVLASMVLAEKRKSEHSNRQSLISAIANIMGLRDVNNIQDKTTLFDLGMDSLMSTEIKQTLERNYDMVLSAQDIRQLTFTALKQIDSKEVQGKAASSDAVTPKTASTSSAANQAGRTNIAQTDETRKVFAKEVLPQDVLVHLHSMAMKTGNEPAVFFVAPIEGFTIAIETLAASLTCPAYGLQWTEEVPLDSIEACTAYYLQQIQQLQPRGPYNIVGYSYGCLLAHAIGVALEQRRFGVKVIMLDGAPTMASGYVQEAKKQTDDLNRQQSMTLAYFGALLADVDYNQLLQLLEGVKTWPLKLDKLADTLASHTQQTKEVIKKAACMFKQKLLLSESYKGAKQLNSDVVLIKSAEHNAIMSQDDYGLKEICSAQIDMHVVAGTHRTFLKEAQTLQIIERVLQKESA
ncbi:fatty acid synthase [Drosophila grimshawi]|uniref:Fatty acid synthase n=1 Tax=Drosophila grimshawi TaxID=7222 RepID=B4JBC9_DROGR|nr:fatty acid synthase [Drosophila grimshawi]XP_032591585.1 fatty acid synthase [Drosophila grimshawi]XP_043070334.1 fatty acid synthase [Drosophila grimshawi]EDW02934.1 GH10962 [Drosophila grimshawi]